jgi:DNA polymerase (family X)
VALHTALGVTTAADLVNELRRRTIRDAPGLGASVERAIADALPTLRSRIPRLPLGRAVALAEPLLRRLRALPGFDSAVPVGSLRRGQDLIGDLEMIAPSTDPAASLAEIVRFPEVERIRYRGSRRIYLVTEGVQVGVRLPPPAAAGSSLLHLTGSPLHLDRLYRLASDRGFVFDADGMHALGGGPVVASTEEEMYHALGLPFIAPELRSGEDEIDAGARGELPTLVSRSDIRGDLHMHTHWSDGRDSIEAMVRGCIALGYDYLAITDHSPHSAASRNLSIADVPRQAAEIAAIRERYPQITILHGCEVDILPDGHLDFPERVLREFDVVLASLHESAGHSPDRLLRRYAAAMEHPLVSIVTHPMNRPGPTRRGYDLDVDRLFELAVETQTVLEIDGAPSHLDLESSLARRAIRGGVLLAIDSDAHRPEMLERHMTLGLLTARRGWVEARHVLNTRSLSEVQAVLAAKRAKDVGRG